MGGAHLSLPRARQGVLDVLQGRVCQLGGRQPQSHSSPRLSPLLPTFKSWVDSTASSQEAGHACPREGSCSWNPVSSSSRPEQHPLGCRCPLRITQAGLLLYGEG